MTITLERFANGDTDYINKHNNNVETIEQAIENLQTFALNNSEGGVTSAVFMRALFGETASLIGAGSYACSGASTTLTVQSGYCWRPSLEMVVAKITSTTINFSGVSAGTWYITVGIDGVPVRVSSSVEAAYSVVWTGSAFGTITRLLPIVWGAADDVAAQASAALSASYTSLDSRLEAGETKAQAGDLARNYVLGRLSKSVAGNTNVSLTATEANNMELNFTGLVTGNIDIDITLASAPRAWLAINSTTGDYKLTLKGSGGSGVALPSGAAILVYSDGTNILPVAKEAIQALTYASTMTADFSRADTVKVTLGGNPTITLSGAQDKQKCILELTQDDVGGRTVTLVNHRFGSDLTSITLSTGAGLTDKIGFIYDAAAGKFDVVALARGY